MKCNHCEADFNLSSDLIFEETISQENEIREKYFICPVCKHHYYVLVTDKEMRKAIERRKIIQTIIKTKYKGSGNVVGAKKLMKEDEKIKESLKKREEELKVLYLVGERKEDGFKQV